MQPGTLITHWKTEKGYVEHAYIHIDINRADFLLYNMMYYMYLLRRHKTNVSDP